MNQEVKLKRIGIPAWVIEGRVFGVGLSYIEFISKFGEPIIISPIHYIKPPEIDLLILPGGADVNPLTYGETPHFRTQSPNVILEHFDAKILPHYIDNNTPIFGICRGFQKLWTLFGGKLNQHVDNHKQSTHPKEDVHELEFTKEFSYMKKMIKKVTSRHHQTAIHDENTSENLEVIAYAKESYNDIRKDIVEMFKLKGKNIYGVQFHPEDNPDSDELTTSIILELLYPKKEENLNDR